MKHRRLILAAILALCSFPLWAAKKELPPAITETEVWFDDVKTPMALTAEQGLEITKKLREALLAKKSIPDTLAAVAFQDNTPRVLFITLGDGSFPGRTYYASGASFQDTLARLLAIIAKREPEYAEAMRNELEGQISRAKEEFARLDSDAKRRNMLRNNPLLRNPLPEPIRRKLANPLAWNSLRLDVVQATIPIRDFVISKSRLLLTSAVGIAFDPVAAFAFTPEQLTGRALMNDERQLSVSAIANLVNESNLWSAGQLWMKMGAATTGFNVSIFESDSYYADSKGAERLFRGHPVQCRLDTAKAVLDSATALAAKLRGMLKENGRYDRPFLEWVPSRTDGKPAVSDQAQLVLALLRTASLPEMPKSQRESLLSGAAAAAKPILKALKHFDPEELVPDFTASTAERKPAAERFFAAIVEEESVEDDSAISGNQMEISRRILELQASANAYLALSEIVATFPEKDPLVRDCRAELRPLMNYLLAEMQPNAEFVPARTYPDGRVLLEWQPGPVGRAETVSLCGLAMNRHLELFPEEAEKLNIPDRLLLLRSTLAHLTLEEKVPAEFPLTPWLAEFLAQDAPQHPERMVLLLKLALAALDGLEQALFLPDMFGAPMDVPSMTYAAERVWLVCNVLEAMHRQGGNDDVAAEILQECWPMTVFMQQAFLSPETASALPQPEKYLGFYRDNLADFGFTMNGQTTQLLARLQLAATLARLRKDAIEPMPQDLEKYNACWKRINEHPAVLAPELVIRSSVAGSGNDRALGGKIDSSAVQTNPMTLEEYRRRVKQLDSTNSGKSRVIRRKK